MCPHGVNTTRPAQACSSLHTTYVAQEKHIVIRVRSKKKSLSSLWTVHRPHACHLIARHAQCQPQRSLRYMFTNRSLSCSHKYARLCWLILLQLQLDEPYEQLINLNNDQHASATERLSPPTCLRQIVLQLQFGSVHHHTLKRWETGCTHTQAQDHSDALLQRELRHQEERAQQQWETDCLRVETTKIAA